MASAIWKDLAIAGWDIPSSWAVPSWDWPQEKVAQAVGLTQQRVDQLEENISNANICNAYIPNLSYKIKPPQKEEIYRRHGQRQTQEQIAADFYPSLNTASRPIFPSACRFSRTLNYEHKTQFLLKTPGASYYSQSKPPGADPLLMQQIRCAKAIFGPKYAIFCQVHLCNSIPKVIVRPK